MFNGHKWQNVRIARISQRANIQFAVALGGCLLLLLVMPIVANAPQSAVRLHVIAHSDSLLDQSIKLSVRDAVLGAMGPALETAPGKAEAREQLLKNGDALQRAAESALQERGANYSARLYYGDAEFPDRMYGSHYYPAGEYEALRVVLGEGGGENWWCVMFPPLCLVDLEQAGEPAVSDEIVFESALAKLFASSK